MKKLNEYLGVGVTETFIPLPDDVDLAKATRDVKSYCFHYGVKNTIETIYGCNSKGKGFRFLHINLDKAIERRAYGKKCIDESDRTQEN